jgi:hypothetical protein
MAKSLAELLKLDVAPEQIIFVGVPELTAVVSSKGEPYYKAMLKTPISVRCTTDPKLPALPTDHLYIRQSALTSTDWKYTDPKKPELGFWMDGWMADFSVNQRVAIYQDKSIREYIKGERENKKTQRHNDLATELDAMVQAFNAKKAAK